ncbi:hypothetical protein [Streptomyces sediminimaris]|uniref:hypothetical protein n=1 Tax=Streptomyces sediminimaris TaxID=3383721 RepID=UPI00399A1CBD
MAQQEHRSSSVTLPGPLRNAASALRKVPGAAVVGRAAEQALDKVGAVSPRGRRLAVYAGAGVLGVAGVVEWPVAVTGAAVAWLTQPRPGERPEREAGEERGGSEDSRASEDRGRGGEREDEDGEGSGDVIAPGYRGAVPVDEEPASPFGTEPVDEQAAAYPGAEGSADDVPAAPFRTETPTDTESPASAGAPPSDPAGTTPPARAGTAASAGTGVTPPDPTVATPPASAGPTPPGPVREAEATEPGEPDRGLLGGGGPLTDEDAPAAPADRTTG